MANTTAENGSILYVVRWIEIAEGIVGMVLNTLAWLVILRTKNLHNMTNYLLAYLAVVDTLACFSLLVFCAMKGTVPESLIARGIYCWVIYSLFLQYTIVYTSSYGLCVATYERYIGIVHPLHYPRLLSAKKVMAIIFITWMIGCLFASPFLLSYTASKDTQYACDETPSSQTLASIGYSMGIIFTYLLSLTFMSWAYYKIQATLKISARQLRQQNVQAAANELLQARQKVVNMLMIVMGALFVLCTPQITMITLYLVDVQNELHKSQVAYTVVWISGGLYYMNSVINPIIYVFKYKSFRKGLKDMMHCRISRPVRPNQVGVESNA